MRITTSSIFLSFSLILFNSFLCTNPSRPCSTYNRCRSEGYISEGDPFDQISYGKEATDLTSDGGTFQLGFFDGGNNIYVGIWYTQQHMNLSVLPKASDVVIVWVANRNNPIPLNQQKNCFLSIAVDGNAKLQLRPNNVSYWSTSYTTNPSNASNMVLQLLDSGNLILKDSGSRGETLWQSFNYPTDTFLPGMIVVNLTSWKTDEDPGEGNYLLLKRGELFMYHISQTTTKPSWKSAYSSLHPYIAPLLNNNGNSSSALRLRLVMNSTGSVQLWKLNSEPSSLLWVAPNDLCDYIDVCGKNGVCGAGKFFKCKCLSGYEPNDPVMWGSGDFSSGCIKTNNHQSSRICNSCGTNVIPYPLSTQRDCGDPAYFQFQCNTTNGQVYFHPHDGNAYEVSLINPTYRIFSIQLPAWTYLDTCSIAQIQSKIFNLNKSSPFSVQSCSIVPPTDKQVVVAELSWTPAPPPACNFTSDCKDWPFTSCVIHKDGKKSCLCPREFSWDPVHLNCTNVHQKLLATSMKAGIAAASGLALLLIGSVLFILCRRRNRAIQRAGIINQLKTDNTEDIDIPFVDYQIIVAATENFSEENKLGAGGFGPVYKGTLTDGTEIAVKRLSAASAQGLEEFRNEVVLIAKLQHRNLVRVLGYCMKEEEKILIYEYMPNKSLSSYLFDQSLSSSLDWMKRLNIILGIARGLLYLHQDSRLNIIHRDLKPSNILLDEDLNPKISDFGLARIVVGNEMSAATVRVVGTYGYMPPEYALDGYFSVKTDVYSFGIVVLEVISRRKCTSLFEFESSLISLLGYAWTLWNQERALELVDRSIVDSCDGVEVQRCINVALLCVQEDPSDRPTMPKVVMMLDGGDNVCLPNPGQPVFVSRKPPPVETALLSSNSDVELTTSLQGR